MSAKGSRVNYPDLDLMKLGMALIVVMIHTHPLTGVPVAGQIFEGLTFLPVPFFFIASAFLCFRGLNSEDFSAADSKGSVRVRKTISKLLRLYVIWTVIYLPVTVFGDFLQGKTLLGGVASFVKGFLFVGENFYSWPLWYLLGSVVAFGLVYLFLRGGVSQRALLMVSAGFLVMGFILPMLQAWEDAPKVVALPVKAYFAVFNSTRNGFFRGFFYVAVGAVLGMRHERLGKIPFSGIVAGAIFGLLGCIFVANSAHLPFCACASICLFLLSVRRCGSGLKPHVVARNASTIIYLVHMIFAAVFVYGICGSLNSGSSAGDYSRPLLFLFSLGGSCLAAAIVIPLSKKAPVLKKIFGI